MAGLHFSSGIDKGFENDLNKMNQQMNSFSSNVSKQSGIINDSFKEIGITLTSILSIGALAQAGKEVINFSNDLQTSLTEVSTVSEEVTNNFDKYKQALLDLSTQSGSSAIQLSNAFYDIVSAGIDGAQGLELLAVAEKASTAGFVEVSTAADGMTTVLNAWGLATSEAGRVSDIFFKTVEKGKTTFPELGANIAKVAPLAASMGISFEETSAAIASVTKQGTQTPEALTQIRAAMVAMNEVLGDGWSKAMTFQEGLQAIADKAGGSQNKLKELLGTDEAVLAVLALTGKNAQGAAADLDAMNNSLGATSAAFEKVNNTASQQGKILVNNLLAAFEPLGTAVVETFASLAKSLNDAFDSGDIKTYAEVLGTLIAAFAAWKISLTTTAALTKTFGKEAQLQALQEQRDKITSINLEIQKQKELIKSAVIVAQTAKAEISALSIKIQAQKTALSQAIANKDLAAAKAAQQKLANLEDQKAAAIIAKKTATEQINNAVIKTNTLQTNLQTVATKSGTIASRLMTAASTKLSGAFKSLKAAIASNPIGLLVTGLTLAIPLISKFIDGLEKTDVIAADMSEVTRVTNTELANQTSELKRLQAQYAATQPGSEQRKKVIEDINKLYPDLLKNIDTEKISLGDLNKVFDSYIANLEKTIRLKTLQSQFEKIISEEIENQSNTDANARYDKQQELNARKKALQEEIIYQKNIVDVNQRYADLVKEQTALLKQREATAIVDDFEKGIQSFEDFVNEYKLVRTKFTKQGAIVPNIPEKELNDAYVAYVKNGDETIKNREKLKERLAQIDKEIEAELKSKTTTTVTVDTKVAVSKEELEKQRKESLSALEIWNQSQINELTKSYGGQEALEKEFSNRMLKQRLDYLTKLQELTTDKLEKLKIEEERINLAFELAGDGKSKLEQLDLNYKKELLLLKAKYKKEEEFNRQALEAEKKYLEEKLKLTTEDSDKLEIQTKLDTVNEAIDESIKAEEFGQRKRIEVIKEAQAKILELEKQLQEDITIAQTQDLQKQIAEQKEIINSAGGADTSGETKVGNDVRNAANYFAGALSDAGDEFSKTIGGVVSDLGAAINITSNQDSSTFEKAQGWFQLAYSSAKKLYTIKDNIAEKDILAQRKLTNSLSDQISMEMRINDIRQERADNDLKSNVFLDPSYIDQATNAVQKQQAAYKSLNDSISALASNAIFTGEGTASRRLFGSKTQSADFSIEQILGDYITAFSGYGVADLFGPGVGQALNGGSIIDVLADAVIDPAGLFGGYAKGKATENALNGIRDTFNAALTAMGKTSADITSLTSEEWLDLFTLLDEAGNIQDEATKKLLENAQESLQAYEDAMAELESVISDVAGSLGGSLGDSIVNAIANGTDALDEFSKSFDDRLIEMAKSTANQIFFQDLFDTLQAEMKASVTGGDNQWQDDLLRFYDQLPTAINGAQTFLTDFDTQLKDLGFEGITGSSTTGGASATTSISESITEQTGTEIKGRINAIMMSNQVIADNSNDMLSYAIQNLVTLNKIKENTDYLPMIAKYTKQTADKL